ncbi:sensor histidine kinase [Streptomyces cinnamoneus]|uniref:histidine kinase n=1 Tax=Streptomyces cinnamoneus TaxID=53446 RepID=A0A2G1XGF2_STRCJ|nr:sensor domain-containing protein [Streptomyces cinnamoneus]PHQ50307.1 sensor histidine kinase [Streptomyces cinnamoneus]PPT12906.1 sensor histidine kinase [Streptomyces cinnamoneus]
MRVRGGLLAGAQGLWLALFGLIGSVLLFTLTVVSIVLVVLGIGFFTTPVMIKALRAFADQRRVLAHEWSGVRIPSPYRPPVPAGGRRGGLAGQVEGCVALLKDPATWRDLQWLLVDMTAGFVLAILAPCLLLYAVWGPVLALGVWKPIVEAGGNEWFTFVHVTGQESADSAAVLGLAYGVLGLFVNPGLLRTNFHLTRHFLRPTRERELALRVDRLTETRHDALDSSAAELRRIERDLHDGAQARLVAVGMSLGAVEALIEKDPQQARKLVAAARATSAEALTELRDLVRGIHPPVLAERGLGDAVRALALRMPLPVEVDVDLAGRAAEPVESAAYFAVSELLTNAAKHAGAERVWVDVHHARGTLRIAVTDDGRGGADPAGGSGLAGLERRLGAFDGVLAVSSPRGGPTMITVEIPCALAAGG